MILQSNRRHSSDLLSPATALANGQGVFLGSGLCRFSLPARANVARLLMCPQPPRSQNRTSIFPLAVPISPKMLSVPWKTKLLR